MSYTESWSGKIGRKLLKKQRIIDVAAGREKADLVLKNATYVNVFSGELDTRDIAVAADSGDELARAIYAECGTRLGEGLALMVDLLNPEAIVIGSIFERSERLLRPAMAAALRREALPQAERVCRVLPAALGDQLGFYASLALAVGGE